MGVFAMNVKMSRPAGLLRVASVALCLVMAGCTVVNLYPTAPAIQAEQTAKQDVQSAGAGSSPAFNIVQNASGLCATIVPRGVDAGSPAGFDLTLALCREGALSQMFLQNPETQAITSPAVPGRCLTSVRYDTGGTPRGHVGMAPCAKGAAQGWHFSSDPARWVFADGMVLDASDLSAGQMANHPGWDCRS